MSGTRTVGFNASLRTSHRRGCFRHVEVLPVTKQESLSLTGGQLGDLFLDDPDNLAPFDLVSSTFRGLGSCQRLEGFERIGVVLSVRRQGRKQGDPGIADLLAPKMIVDRVLQYSGENQGEFGRGAVCVVNRQLHHRVLDDVERGVVVAHGKRGLLESTPLDAGKEIVEFLFGGHDEGPGGRWERRNRGQPCAGCGDVSKRGTWLSGCPASWRPIDRTGDAGLRFLMRCGIVARSCTTRKTRTRSSQPSCFRTSNKRFAAPAVTSGYGTASNQSPVDLERISRCCPSAQKCNARKPSPRQ